MVDTLTGALVWMVVVLAVFWLLRWKGKL